MTSSKPPRPPAGDGSPGARAATVATPPTLPTDPIRESSGLRLPPAGDVVSLRVVGTAVELLLPEKPTFTIGSKPEPDVDLRVSSSMLGDRARGEHVSGVHLLVQRKSNRLWIRDQGSTNGTLVNDAEVTEAEIVAGRTFRVGDVTLLAMDQHLRRLRPHLLWTLGLSAHDHVDRALGVVVSGDALLLVGERGCDQRALAEEIHRASSRRDRAFVPIQGPLEGRPEQVAQLAHASRGTAYLDLDDFGELPAFFVGHLFGDEYLIRPILSAPDFATAARRLGEHFAPRLRVITVPAIRDRRRDVPRLLDILFRRILEQRRRAAGAVDQPTAEARRQVDELGAETVARLVAFDWPDNFADLERNAARLLALIENQGNLRAAARSLGVSHKALGDALKRIGVRD